MVFLWFGGCSAGWSCFSAYSGSLKRLLSATMLATALIPLCCAAAEGSSSEQFSAESTACTAYMGKELSAIWNTSDGYLSGIHAEEVAAQVAHILATSSGPCSCPTCTASNADADCGLSPGELAAAIVVPIVGCSALIALVLLLGSRRMQAMRSSSSPKKESKGSAGSLLPLSPRTREGGLSGFGGRVSRERISSQRFSLSGPTAHGHGPLTTLVLTDIQNSTVLWEMLPTTVMDTAMNIHDATLRGGLEKFGGYESGTEGDAFIISFANPSKALSYCMEVQLKLLHADWPAQVMTMPDARSVFALKDGVAPLPPDRAGNKPQRSNGSKSSGLSHGPQNGVSHVKHKADPSSLAAVEAVSSRLSMGQAPDPPSARVPNPASRPSDPSFTWRPSNGQVPASLPPLIQPSPGSFLYNNYWSGLFSGSGSVHSSGASSVQLATGPLPTFTEGVGRIDYFGLPLPPRGSSLSQLDGVHRNHTSGAYSSQRGGMYRRAASHYLGPRPSYRRAESITPKLSLGQGIAEGTENKQLSVGQGGQGGQGGHAIAEATGGASLSWLFGHLWPFASVSGAQVGEASAPAEGQMAEGEETDTYPAGCSIYGGQEPGCYLAGGPVAKGEERGTYLARGPLAEGREGSSHTGEEASSGKVSYKRLWTRKPVARSEVHAATEASASTSSKRGHRVQTSWESVIIPHTNTLAATSLLTRTHSRRSLQRELSQEVSCESGPRSRNVLCSTWIQDLAKRHPKMRHNADATDLVLILRGLRVRMGMHCGILDPSDVTLDAALSQTTYSGPCMDVARAVADSAPGAGIVLSADAFFKLQESMLDGKSDNSPFVVYAGDYVPNFDNVSKMPLYLAVPRSLQARLPHIPSIRYAVPAALGTLSAPVGTVSITFMYVIGAAQLLTDIHMPARTALNTFLDVVLPELYRHNGYVINVVDGLVVAAFSRPVDGVAWGLACIQQMVQQDWPEELLGHAFGMEETLNDLMLPRGRDVLPAERESRSMVGGWGDTQQLFGNVSATSNRRARLIKLRGIRIKCGVDMGQVACMVDPTTGRLHYRGKVMNRASRVGSMSIPGSVLCSDVAWQYIAAEDEECRRGLRAVSLGEFDLKGVAGPMVLMDCNQELAEDSIEPVLDDKSASFISLGDKQPVFMSPIQHASLLDRTRPARFRKSPDGGEACTRLSAFLQAGGCSSDGHDDEQTHTDSSDGQPCSSAKGYDKSRFAGVIENGQCGEASCEAGPSGVASCEAGSTGVGSYEALPSGEGAFEAGLFGAVSLSYGVASRYDGIRHVQSDEAALSGAAFFIEGHGREHSHGDLSPVSEGSAADRTSLPLPIVSGGACTADRPSRSAVLNSVALPKVSEGGDTSSLVHETQAFNRFVDTFSASSI